MDKVLELSKKLADLEAENAKLREALELIARGHHDPQPTRRIYGLSGTGTDAMNVDSWWQDYYTSNDKQNKSIARAALEEK